MTRRATSFAAVFGTCAVLFAASFVLAPQSCSGGWTIYFWAGVAALGGLLILPLVMRNDAAVLVRIGWGIAFVVVGAMTWIAGLFAANFRIICTLF